MSNPDPATLIAALACNGPCCAKAVRLGRGEIHCVGPNHPNGDRKPSLSVSRGATQPTVFHCKSGGCSQDEIIAELQARGIWSRPSEQRERVVPFRRDRQPVRVTVYQIKNGEGVVEAEHVREDYDSGDKALHWRRSDGTLGLGGRKASSLPLFGAELLAGLPDGTPVVVCEGEPATDAARQLGLVAVGTVTGAANTPDDEALRQLVRLDPALWADHDDEGRGHMRRIAERVRALGGKPRLLRWDGASEKGDDAANFLERGGTPDEAATLVATAVVFDPRLERLAGLGLMTADHLMTLELPEPKCVIEGIVAEGLNLLGGKSKMGKSWKLLGSCVAIASGGKDLGKIATEEGDVLYLALEDPPRRVQERLGALLQGRPAPKRLTIATEWPRGAEGIAAIDAWLDLHPEARMVAIDTWPKFRARRSGRNGDPFQEDYDAAAEIKACADRHGVAIVVVIHLRKAIADDWVDQINATSGVAAAADGIAVLHRERGSADAVLKVTGRELNDAELALQWDTAASGWVHVGEAQEYRQSRERLQIIHAVGELGGSATPTDVSMILGIKLEAAKSRMWRMSRDGTLAVEKGRYSVHGVQPAQPKQPAQPVQPVQPDDGNSVAESDPVAPANGHATGLTRSPVAPVAPVAPWRCPRPPCRAFEREQHADGSSRCLGCGRVDVAQP